MPSLLASSTWVRFGGCLPSQAVSGLLRFFIGNILPGIEPEPDPHDPCRDHKLGVAFGAASAGKRLRVVRPFVLLLVAERADETFHEKSPLSLLPSKKLVAICKDVNQRQGAMTMKIRTLIAVLLLAASMAPTFANIAAAYTC